MGHVGGASSTIPHRKKSQNPRVRFQAFQQKKQNPRVESTLGFRFFCSLKAFSTLGFAISCKTGRNRTLGFVFFCTLETTPITSRIAFPKALAAAGVARLAGLDRQRVQHQLEAHRSAQIRWSWDSKPARWARIGRSWRRWHFDALLRLKNQKSKLLRLDKASFCRKPHLLRLSRSQKMRFSP